MTRRILVTGASSGIGRAAAIALAQPDHHLILTARRAEELESVAEACGLAGGSGETWPLDLMELDKIEAAATRLLAKDGYPVLINSAGIGVFNQFANLSWDDIESQINLNLVAPAKLIHACLPGMLERGGGQIINVLSMTCEHVLPGGGGYSTAKAGLRMLGKVIAQEYRRQGIKVTNLMPGAVDTPIWDGSPMVDRKPEMIPTQEVANLIAQLVNNPNSFNMDEVLMMPPQGVL